MSKSCLKKYLTPKRGKHASNTDHEPQIAGVIAFYGGELERVENGFRRYISSCGKDVEVENDKVENMWFAKGNEGGGASTSKLRAEESEEDEVEDLLPHTWHKTHPQEGEDNEQDELAVLSVSNKELLAKLLQCSLAVENMTLSNSKLESNMLELQSRLNAVTVELSYNVTLRAMAMLRADVEKFRSERDSILDVSTEYGMEYDLQLTRLSYIDNLMPRVMELLNAPSTVVDAAIPFPALFPSGPRESLIVVRPNCERDGEKKGGRGVRWRVVEEFQDIVNGSCLLEANSSGSEYTWCNGKMGNNRILCKLDRMLCNQAWSNLFPGWKYKVMARVKSDHSPLFGCNVGIPKAYNVPFCFCNMWTRHDSFLQVVAENLNQPIVGDPLFLISCKLRCLKSRLKEWNTSVFGHNKRHIQGLKHLSKWLEMYQESSGKIFSSEKSKLFPGAMSNTKKQIVKAILGFDEGCLPTTYLGIPLVQGRVTRTLFRPLVEKIKRRATGWAGSLLSLQGRALLVQSVLSSISIYSMGIYKWPASLIKEGERILCNFFWYGEPDSRKACVVAWDKLSWNFLNPTDGWSDFMRAKFISKSGNFSRITKGSSIWVGVRGAIEDVRAHSGWVIGDGASIDLWRDNWCSSLTLKDWINDDHIPWKDLHAKLSSIIIEGRWAIPGNPQLSFQRLGLDIHSIKINKNNADRRVWKPDLMGKFSVKGAFKAIRNKDRTVWWASFLFNKAIHPKLAMWG
ncbi:hypothetical protein GIB67_032540 [Kingdonia uniflora]|uniref:Uncharacterized protein n=1 Tax=Kingdonia uniflora TaxID=39325 RepID=A0A7J7L7N0_9MAGN|nr:hypothetical protein GIB67_032540 [Kingdonia uniflora]